MADARRRRPPQSGLSGLCHPDLRIAHADAGAGPWLGDMAGRGVVWIGHWQRDIVAAPDRANGIRARGHDARGALDRRAIARRLRLCPGVVRRVARGIGRDGAVDGGFPGYGRLVASGRHRLLCGRPGRHRLQAKPPRRATSPAMTALPPSLARPSATPCRSAAVRFWLTFHLPSMREIGISTPMMARICAAMNSGGA
ncbi:hypothetical protein G6F24_015785 [Rhizopus arrhizus]|nr:hypothetical protein G6F24_015785 [Rhizopus arrhizus]